MADDILLKAVLPDERATERLAAWLAALARPGDVLALSGDLGSGKTAFARAFVRSLPGGEDEEVPSPTFTLVQIYDTATGEVWHFDLYRLERPEDALELGMEEAFAEAISLIEWPDRLGAWLPRDRLDIEIGLAGGETERRVTMKGRENWRQRLEETARWLRENNLSSAS